MSEKITSINQSKITANVNIWTHIGLYFTGVYQVISIIVLVYYVISGFKLFRTPFIGTYINNNLRVNTMLPVKSGSWYEVNGLTNQDQLIAIDAVGINSLEEYLSILQTHNLTDVVTLALRSPHGNIREILVPLQEIPLVDRITLLAIPAVVGLIYFGCGLWIFSVRRSDESGRAFSLFAASAAIVVAGFLDVNTTNSLVYLWVLSLAIASGSLINLALVYPGRSSIFKRYLYLRWIGYGIVALFVSLEILSLFVPGLSAREVLIRRLAFIFVSVAVLFFLSLTVIRRSRTPSPVIRQQGLIIIWGSIVAFLPITIWFTLNIVNASHLFFSTLLFLPLGVFPVTAAFVLVRYRLIRTDYLFNQTILYALLTILVVIGYTLVVGGISLLVGEVIPANSPAVIGLIVFILALTLNPVRFRLQSLVDRLFFRGQQVSEEIVQDFSHKLSPAMELKDIVNLLRTNINGGLMPSKFHFFVLDSLREQYIATPDETGHVTSDIQFSTQSPLPQMLAHEKTFVFFNWEQEIIPVLAPDKNRIALLAAQLFVPMFGRTNQVIGFMALAPRSSGEPYTNTDILLLSSLCDQAAMAVERAQVVADLERRVNEMNVLTRVAQGINVTLRFDDILELIYAQANRIIPSRDFWILLYNTQNDYHYYAFYLEDDRRLLNRENHPLAGEIDLAQEIIRSGQSLTTDNFERESRSRGITPQVKGLHTWLGVPLNAGAITIGALSLGSRDSSVVFSIDQVQLLQAIADQAAGAIVKARLLEDSERSARQLNLLNEVARNLTSNLELSNLLDQILENAIDIIGCEAGTLFLVDEDTGELVFEVVKGPVADELRGKRLPPGTGHVGRSVESGKAAIVNEARQTIEWAGKPDQQTGFQTRDLLLVPMFAQDRIIGVLEVINRRDGLPFAQDDQDLLTAFTSQAAIALENARLYTLTDQQLADRVDELSVMQRIDRDLNASLDISRAMRITLDWAMRRSTANAGLVGIMGPNGVRVMADQGYSDELNSYRESVLPIELPGLKKAVDDEETQQFHRTDFNGHNEGKFTLLDAAQSQIVIPIRREERVIGVLILESLGSDPWTEEIQEFLSRLSDHAAIAIANAQLFAQVQEADIAKSDFVSFVSHELKTPMTSIRGYTDLLLGGAVGEINVAQENFLNTIRTNVNRMATLVSDLADVSRIEAGRLRLEFAAVDISSAVQEVARSQAHVFEEKEQQLKLQILDNLLPVWGDHTRIVQVLTNLISNASKYTLKGGTVTINAKQFRNQWDPDGAPEVMLISVQDTGIGMSDEDQALIFTKFFRSADPKAREVPGTGLGLNIARFLVEMQGGKIWFESNYGIGTTFFFTVPIAEV